MIHRFYSVLKDKFAEGVDYIFDNGVPKRYENLTWIGENKPSEEQFNIWIDEYNQEEAFKQLRKKRDFLLQESDWVTLRAYDQQTQVPEEWAIYRQKLRDLTNQTPEIVDNGILKNTSVDWPVKPL